METAKKLKFGRVGIAPGLVPAVGTQREEQKLFCVSENRSHRSDITERVRITEYPHVGGVPTVLCWSSAIPTLLQQHHGCLDTAPSKFLGGQLTQLSQE